MHNSELHGVSLHYQVRRIKQLEFAMLLSVLHLKIMSLSPNLSQRSSIACNKIIDKFVLLSSDNFFGNIACIYIGIMYIFMCP
jgi:hypothetical protein